MKSSDNKNYSNNNNNTKDNRDNNNDNWSNTSTSRNNIKNYYKNVSILNTNQCQKIINNFSTYNSCNIP